MFTRVSDWAAKSQERVETLLAISLIVSKLPIKSQTSCPYNIRCNICFTFFLLGSMRTASSVCSHLQDVNVAYRIFENSIVAIPNILGRPEILRISGLATQ